MRAQRGGNMHRVLAVLALHLVDSADDAWDGAVSIERGRRAGGRDVVGQHAVAAPHSRSAYVYFAALEGPLFATMSGI